MLKQWGGIIRYKAGTDGYVVACDSAIMIVLEADGPVLHKLHSGSRATIELGYQGNIGKLPLQLLFMSFDMAGDIGIVY